jgi:hypothetical protein
MDEIKFWQVVKKKIVPILVITLVLTFVVIKVIDFILNWYLNRDTAAYGVYYNFTVSLFSPIFFIILFVIVTNIVKKYMNKDVERKQGVLFKYHRGFTWRDIYRDKDAFAFFLIVAFGIFILLYNIVQWISGLSLNYAISSMRHISTELLIVISAVVAVWLVVFLQNTIIAWLIKTEKGNKMLGLLVLIFGILTALVMCGISYLWTPIDELSEDLKNDFYVGLLIPFDMTTIFYGLVTLWLAKMAKPYAKGQQKIILIGVITAVISVIISFTPAQMVIQFLVIFLAHGSEVANM